MIIDTSVLLAITFNEPEASRFSQLLRERDIAIAAPTLLESEIVVRARLGVDALNDLRGFLDRAQAEVVAFDAHQVRMASEAYARYGRGSEHPANLNYGDCFSYALAIARDEPLLFKGDDFIHTDVRVALE